MYPFVATAMGETDANENDRTIPQSKRPRLIGAINASSVNDTDGESVGAMNTENTVGGSNVGEYGL